jgi:hypothetical protein
MLCLVCHAHVAWACEASIDLASLAPIGEPQSAVTMFSDETSVLRVVTEVVRVVTRHAHEDMVMTHSVD